MSSMSPCCRLCAAPGSGISLTEVHSELGKREKLEFLIKQYIDTHLLLPKCDRLCLCDTCKTRLRNWHSFIVSCQKAQEQIKQCAFSKRTNDINQCKIDNVTNGTAKPSTSESFQKMKRSSNYCIARWCNKGNYRGVSLFRLPKDRNRALVWLSGAERLDLKNKPNLHSYYMCGNHFTPNMFTNKARNQLIRKAEPTLFPRLSLPNKFDKKHAVSLLQPTQFQGVQLKSILPKSTPAGGKSKELDVKILQCTPGNKSLTIGSNVGLEGMSPELTSIQNVLYIVNSASCMPLNVNTTTSSRNHVTPCITTFTNGEGEVTENDNILIGAPLKYNILTNVDNEPSNEESNSHGKATFSTIKESNEISFMSNDPTETHAELSSLLVKGQKSFLDDISSCLASDAFSATSLLNVNDSFQDSITFRESKPSSSYKSHSQSKVGVSNITDHTQSNENHKLSSVGSQDFLLPHVSEMVDKQSIHFSEPSFPLKSEATPETACVATLKVSRDNNLILNQAIESKSPSTSLFDLQADDIQGADHSSYISGVDEFLDLDRYF